MSGRRKSSTPAQGADEKHESANARPASGLGRAVRLLDLIVAEGPLRFAQIEELVDIPKASLHRLLKELADERLVQFDERVLTWSAGYRVLEMANRIWTRSDIRVLARDQLLALNAFSGESVQIAVLADTHGVVIDHVESSRSVRHSINVGNREPVYCTGSGKVLLAWCDEVQRDKILSRISFVRFTPNTITDKKALTEELSLISNRGYAIDAEERFLGTCCIAAPIVDATGQAVAGLSITAPAFRTRAEDLENWRESLMASAAEVSRRLAPRTGPSISIAH
ncbi:MAG: IclR family transcriptional regulator [Granulosicoccus sp.]